MKKILILLFTLFYFTSFSQDIIWENYKEIDGVIVNKGSIECYDNEILTFEIKNTNNYKITVSWYEEVWVDGVCKQNGASQEHYRKITLNPEETVQGDCTFQKSFYIGSKVYRGSKVMILTHFQLNNIIVEKEK